jgi:hypothetical protein
MQFGSAPISGAIGTVTTFSVTTANGVSGVVANATTTPAVTITLGAITPTTVTASATIATAAPAGSTAGLWKLGAANVQTPTSPNRTVTIDIGGTVYYLSAKTTND